MRGSLESSRPKVRSNRPDTGESVHKDFAAGCAEVPEEDSGVGVERHFEGKHHANHPDGAFAILGSPDAFPDTLCFPKRAGRNQVR